MKKPNNGYLVVASRQILYYNWAIQLLESVKDFYPEAQVCLVTEEKFLDGRESVADHLIFCDDHVRAKLWGMAQTPFDTTFYMDADMDCIHEDIAKVFDELGDSDLAFAGLPKNRWDIFKDTEFPGGTFKLCGGVCLYRSSDPLVMEFMNDWYEYYKKQEAGDWWPLNENNEFDKENYPYHLRIWDQFTLWWLTEKEKKYSSLKVKIFDDDLKWNYWALWNRRFPMPDDTVLVHYSGVEGLRNSANSFKGTFIDYEI